MPSVTVSYKPIVSYTQKHLLTPAIPNTIPYAYVDAKPEQTCKGAVAYKKNIEIFKTVFFLN